MKMGQYSNTFSAANLSVAEACNTFSLKNCSTERVCNTSCADYSSILELCNTSAFIYRSSEKLCNAATLTYVSTEELCNTAALTYVSTGHLCSAASLTYVSMEHLCNAASLTYGSTEHLCDAEGFAKRSTGQECNTARVANCSAGKSCNTARVANSSINEECNTFSFFNVSVNGECDTVSVANDFVRHLSFAALSIRMAAALFMFILFAGYLNAQPIKIHSHNDYTRRVPFYQAYAQQCSSIEADVFATARADELLVAHNSDDLHSALTLDELYIEPLVAIFRQNGGRAWRNSEKTMVLLVDLKTPADSTLPRVIKKLAQYPDVFDPTNNPYAVRVVISGSVPLAEQFETYPSFIYFDGSRTDYTPQQLQRIFMISMSLRRQIGWNGQHSISASDSATLSKIVEQAHALGKPIRFWATPDNANVWKTLHELGVDYINTDRPEACAAFFNGEKW